MRSIKNGELYTEVTISENTLPYLEQVRPEMLKLYELLNTREILTFQKEGAKGIQSYNYWITELRRLLLITLAIG